MSFQGDLQQAVNDIFTSPWKKQQGRIIPVSETLSLKNDARVLKEATVLYADLADSTVLVDQHRPDFAARLYKAYLRCAARIIKDKKGEITAYDGDRVMAVFIGENQQDLAVRTAMEINYTVRKIINPRVKQHFPRENYQLKHVIGIDTSELFIARIGVNNENDLVWVGRAANYAAKLCSLDDSYAIYITNDVYAKLPNNLIYASSKSTPIWQVQRWGQRNNLEIHKTTYYRPIS